MEARMARVRKTGKGTDYQDAEVMSEEFRPSKTGKRMVQWFTVRIVETGEIRTVNLGKHLYFMKEIR